MAKKYGQPRRSLILYDRAQEDGEEEESAMPDYPVTVFFTKEGYFKKITPQSLRMSGEQKLKEGDEVRYQQETRNDAHLLFFTNRQQVYKCRAGDFEDGKASQLGDYIPARLGMEEGEMPIFLAITTEYSGHMLFFYQTGKCARIPMEGYATKTNRRKLLNAYSGKDPLAADPRSAPGYRAGGAHQRRQAAAGALHPDQREADQDHSRRGGGHLEEEPDHHRRPPGRSAGAGQSPPLPGSHSACRGRTAAQRGPGGANQPWGITLQRKRGFFPVFSCIPTGNVL